MQGQKQEKTSPNGSRVRLWRFLDTPFPLPFGEAIRRHVARGVGLKPHP